MMNYVCDSQIVVTNMQWQNELVLWISMCLHNTQSLSHILVGVDGTHNVDIYSCMHILSLQYVNQQQLSKFNFESEFYTWKVILFLHNTKARNPLLTKKLLKHTYGYWVI